MQGFRTGRPRIGTEAVDGPSNTAKHSLVFDSPQIPLGGRFEVDAVGSPGHDIRTLQAEFSLDLRPAATAWLFQRPACGREVDPVLERLQQFKVIGADKGRDGFSVPFKHDTFALVGDTVDRFRKRVTNGGGRKSGHLRRGPFIPYTLYVLYILYEILGIVKPDRFA